MISRRDTSLTNADDVGYPQMACRNAAGVRRLTRNGHDWATRGSRSRGRMKRPCGCARQSGQCKEYGECVGKHGKQLLGPWVTNPTREIDAAFATFVRERPDVLSVVGASPLQQPPLPSQAGGVSFLAGT
jgi:hypothetical protein